ncbi:hypothetical protein [Kibdelosporangium aridum]|uniref:Uncharacterized protein n=1 Tax=Kibdelosporangium aridum TaxID=2030 RepID=A0A1Y5Y129_KIBAR|nr:hypothetical protein [Kibdelosporangium aridum]SMD23515.1 hypothetical protein SAMN05661093_08043 [Kibdelosporangium aridum]
MARLLLEMTNAGTCVLASGRSFGAGWTHAGLHLESESAENAVLLEVRNDAQIVQAMIREVECEDFSGRVRQANTVFTLTLVGTDVNWGLVRAVWQGIEALWPTVAYDEASGFDVGVDMIG